MGKLAAVAVSTADTDTLIYTVPSDRSGTININCCNIGNSAITIDLGLTTGSNLDDEDYIEKGASIPAGGVLERTGIAVSASEKIMVSASSASLAVRVHGYLEVA